MDIESNFELYWNNLVPPQIKKTSNYDDLEINNLKSKGNYWTTKFLFYFIYMWVYGYNKIVHVYKTGFLSLIEFNKISVLDTFGASKEAYSIKTSYWTSRN